MCSIACCEAAMRTAPGGAASAFWEAVNTMSAPSLSKSRGTPPIAQTESTTERTPAFAHSSTSSGTWLMTELEVSTWVMKTTLYFVFWSLFLRASGSAAFPRVNSMLSALAPWTWFSISILCPKYPVIRVRVLSPWETRLTTEDSIPVVPVPVNTN